jgi:glycogen debranching enzyme
MARPPGSDLGARHETEPDALWALGVAALDRLEDPRGYLASGSEDGLYATFFGRDSLWMLLLLLEAEGLGVAPSLGERVEAAGARILRSVAELQGERIDDAIEEQPGKIIHEFRPELDERLVRYEMPFRDGRSYASFDATFLFVCAYAGYARRFRGHEMLAETWPALERALAWIDEYADDDGDGLYEYRRRDPRNPLNQVWKDSFDSASTVSGFDVPVAPLAWVEVQAYAARALLEAAALHAGLGRDGEAERLTARAQDVRRAVAERFWLDDGCLALALDGRKRRLPLATSNAGHALWGDLLDADGAARLASRLRRSDLLTTWGLRCLSSASPAYAPFSYHRGNVWPFDNAVVAAGLRRHGFERDALAIAAGVGAALLRFETAIELYVVLDGDLLVDPLAEDAQLLARRRPSQENTTQGFTAAAAVFFAALVARAGGRRLPDR